MATRSTGRRTALEPLPVIQLREVCKSYREGEPVLRRLSLQIKQGEFVAIMGSSGSGKSTLLNILGCLDSPDSGEYRLCGLPILQLDEDALAAVRNRRIGFVFQAFNLLPRIDAQRNVELPMLYAGVDPGVRERRAQAALKIVGLQAQAHHLPAQLSGGQQQRIAIARAIVNDPDIIIADEPTGALDSRTTEEILRLFERLGESGKTLLIVTHEDEVAARSGRVVVLHDGQVEEDGGLPA